MPISFGGMASGVDTDAIIKKLVDVEARPITQWQEDNKRSSQKKQALTSLREHLTKLSGSAKELYGFRAAFFDKKAVSSDPQIVEATANKYAEKGSKTIQVKQLATYHKISSDAIDKNTTLNAGKFTIEVGGESKSIRFNGGSLQKLQEVLQENASNLINTVYLNTFGDQFIFTMESKVPGEKGEIRLSGDRDLLKSIGLVSGEKGEKSAKTSLVFDKKYFTTYIGKQEIGEQNGNLDVDADGKSLKLRGNLWREYVMPIETPVKDETMLVFNIAYHEPPKEQEEELPFRIELGPEEKTIIKGIELQGYNVSRIRPIEKKEPKKQPESFLGIGVVAADDSKRVEKVYSIDRKAKGKHEIPIGKDFRDRKISKIIFYCNEGTAEFSQAEILTPEKGNGLLEPKNVAVKAQNAHVLVDGIEVIRDKNDGLSDIAKGITLNLRRASSSNVTITIESDTQHAIDRIKKFVDDYNTYIDFTGELTGIEKIEGSKQQRVGLYSSDMTILRLENSIKSTVGGAYPSKAEEPIRVITQMGISTGAINTAWENVKRGKLIIDESKLKDTIVSNPDGIKEFFGSDNDGDNKIDNGMAYQLVNTVKPFIMAGKNIIQAKIDYEETQIQTTSQRIDRHRDHLARYEDKLRKKFASMEKSISGAKAQSNWMGQQFKGMSGGKE